MKVYIEGNNSILYYIFGNNYNSVDFLMFFSFEIKKI